MKTDTTEQIIQQVLSTWASKNTAVTSFFNKYKEEAYLEEVAPGRNRAIYLLGHLVATNDGLLPLFSLGQRLFPELEAPFSAQPDRSTEQLPSLDSLKKQWETVNMRLAQHFNAMNASDWLGRHTAVSEADFAAEPHRNKLNVLINRTNHQSYHLGQLNLLTVKELVG
jgi:hypothetical protein